MAIDHSLHFPGLNLLKHHFNLTLMIKGLLFLCMTCFAMTSFAQNRDTIAKHIVIDYTPPAARNHPVRGVYVAGGGDGTILSFAHVTEEDNKIKNVPRFSLILNIGSTANYDFSNEVGIFSGLNIKNIGFITREADVKIKRRVYTLGVPIGFKFGNFNDDFFFYLGGQYEMAFNYKEKRFVDGKKVDKFNEWFSDRTPLLMPSLFAGLKMHDFNVKVQYYPNNFFNTDFTETQGGVTTKPYENMKANMFFISFGYSFEIKNIH